MIPDNPPEGRFLLHYSNPKDWRLRNEDEHPVDPGWEDGVYSDCHPKIRPGITAGTWVMDVVPRLEGDGSRRGVIRSAFEIASNGKDSILAFDCFYFADSAPVELPGPYIQYRAMMIPQEKLKLLLDGIQQSYTRYEKGHRPRSILPGDWSRIKKVRRESLGLPHECD